MLKKGNKHRCLYRQSCINLCAARRQPSQKKQKKGDNMKITVQYTTLIVDDLEESVAFYRDVLGFREGYHVDLPDGGAITIMKSDGGASVELICNRNFPTGMYSIGTDVDDLDAAVSRLKEAGYQTTGLVVQTTVGRMTFTLDPNGVKICLIEHSEEYKSKYV